MSGAAAPAGLLTIVGMHRSGTSAFAGTLQDHGIEFGPVRERNVHNPRGNREIPRLRQLHDRMLKRSGGSWFAPPAEVAVTDADRAERDEVLASIEGETIAVKDPRILLLGELYRDLDPRPIGVIRNPVAVRESLQRREEDPRQPSLPGDEWEALWRHYNRLLLAHLDREAFPLIDFDRRSELDAQARAALAFYGIVPAEEPSSFFEDELVSSSEDSGWRRRALSPESVELWGRLAERTVTASAR